MSIEGSCMCGAVAYRALRLAGPIVHCHCRTCRKSHAAAFASTARVHRSEFAWLRGEDLLTCFESSPGKLRRFCSQCGSHVVAERLAEDQVILRVATLDDDPASRPAASIWRSHEVPWLERNDATPSFDEAPQRA